MNFAFAAIFPLCLCPFPHSGPPVPPAASILLEATCRTAKGTKSLSEGFTIKGSAPCHPCSPDLSPLGPGSPTALQLALRGKEAQSWEGGGAGVGAAQLCSPKLVPLESRRAG